MADRGRAIAEAALHAAGLGPVRALHAIGGSDIAAAYRVESAAQRAFLKIGARAHPFDAEALALAEIAATRTLRVPQVFAQDVVDDAGYLLLEWIDLADEGDWAAAGRQLAAMHACVQASHGWSRENSIGASAQHNFPSVNWAEFFREQRLRPQFALARANRLWPLAALDEVACRASDALLAGHAPPPGLLHGDLWRGNLAFDHGGAPVVFDPASYYGDAETDLAMTRLFGGFPERFHRAYAEASPPVSGTEDRLPLYQLYHVLNHANLFGGSYAAQAAELIGQIEKHR